MATYEKRFRDAIPHILRHEGGYVNHPNDPGGETKYGITKRTYPHLDIRRLTEAQAIEIYYRDWWLKRGYDHLPDGVGEKILDVSINTGHKRAIITLQRAVSRLGYETEDDGLMGSHTLKMVGRAVEREGNAAVVQAICERQAAFYRYLARKNGRFKVFLRGWLRRASWNPLA